MAYIFVFGSNLQGIHGAGAALYARQHHGAQLGVGKGRTGNSYALPTKYTPRQSMPREEVQHAVNEFLAYARSHAKSNPNDYFVVTRVGCGLAGFKDFEIAPMFQGAPKNCIFDVQWEEYLPGYHYFCR